MTEENSPEIWTVIPAAGVGKRMQSDKPKQYLSLHNKTVIEHTLSRITKDPRIKGVVVAISSDDGYWPDLELDLPIPLHVASGGKERSDSVLNALEYLSSTLKLADDIWVLVHDAARPCLLLKDLSKLIDVVLQDTCIGGILAKPVADTMKKAKKGTESILRTESREDLWHALTPQMFQLGKLFDAIHFAIKQGIQVTDESSAMECLGESPLLVESAGSNIKITRPQDLSLADFLLSSES